MDESKEHVNPFASPLAEDNVPVEMIVDTRFEEAITPCPRCSSTTVKPAPYDWWRGRRGPRAIDHVLCQDCNCEYDGVKGKAYPPAKSPWPMFIVAAVLFSIYVLFYVGFNLFLILGEL